MDDLDKKPNICDVCLRTFESEAFLGEHRLVCIRTTHLNCQLCGLSFTDEREITQHQSNCHQDVKTEQFEDVENVSSKHNEVGNESKEKTVRVFHYCQCCELVYHSDDALKAHQQKRKEEERNQVVCKICNLIFASQKSYICHKMFKHPTMKMVTVEPPDKGSIETYTAVVKGNSSIFKDARLQRSLPDTAKQLLSTKQQNNSPKITLLPNGKAKLPEKCYLQPHEEEKNVLIYKGRNICRTCGATFKTENGLALHMQSHRSGPNSKICLPCGLVLHNQQDVTQHVMTVHSNVQWMKCDLCNKPFPTEALLNHHMLSIHTRTSVMLTDMQPVVQIATEPSQDLFKFYCHKCKENVPYESNNAKLYHYKTCQGKKVQTDNYEVSRQVAVNKILSNMELEMKFPENVVMYKNPVSGNAKVSDEETNQTEQVNYETKVNKSPKTEIDQIVVKYEEKEFSSDFRHAPNARDETPRLVLNTVKKEEDILEHKAVDFSNVIQESSEQGDSSDLMPTVCSGEMSVSEELNADHDSSCGEVEHLSDRYDSSETESADESMCYGETSYRYDNSETESADESMYYGKTSYQFDSLETERADESTYYNETSNVINIVPLEPDFTGEEMEDQVKDQMALAQLIPQATTPHYHQLKFQTYKGVKRTAKKVPRPLRRLLPNGGLPAIPVVTSNAQVKISLIPEGSVQLQETLILPPVDRALRPETVVKVKQPADWPEKKCNIDAIQETGMIKQTTEQDKKSVSIPNKDLANKIQVQGQKYQCKICHMTSEDKESVAIHIIEEHGRVRPKPIMSKSKHGRLQKIGKRTYKKNYCHACDKSFDSRHEAQEHRTTHEGQKDFKCRLCAKTFSHAQSLKIHMRVHNNKKPYVCDQCGKAFTFGTAFRSHNCINSDKKNCVHVCEYCGKSFRLASSHRNHLRTIHNKKPENSRRRKLQKRVHLKQHMYT